MTLYPRDEMAKIQRRLTDGTAAIRDNRRLTDHGKRVEMAKVVKAARKQRDELKTSFLTERERRRESLQRVLFGITGDATPEQLMIMRDSRDRAAKIDGPEDAATHLALATAAGDTYMAKAIAMIAVHRGWRELVNTYAEKAPAGTRASLEELADIPTGRNTGLMDTAVFRLSEPDELRQWRTDIDRLAAEATDKVPAGGMQYEGVPLG